MAEKDEAASRKEGKVGGDNKNKEKDKTKMGNGPHQRKRRRERKKRLKRSQQREDHKGTRGRQESGREC